MIESYSQQVIIAQCTPKGTGAIALLRLSGSGVRVLVNSFAQLLSGLSLNTVSSHTIHTGYILDADKNPVDQVMFLVMDGPRTFTGEDVIEITCHNNPFIIQAIIDRAITCGARHAQEGEFSKRAFMHGKLDLIQAEAINELIQASHQMTLKQSMAQLKGSLSAWIVELEKKLIKALALSEASFEFLDEEMEFGSDIYPLINQVADSVKTIKQSFDHQQHIRQGIKIALIGSVNAGKSSLFNALLGHNRAIVTNIPGTTRDVIEAGLYKKSSYWTLIDTAGLRTTDDVIEQEGIERSYEQAHQADIILLVIDRSRELTDQEKTIYQTLLERYSSKAITVYNKADLPAVTQSFLPAKQVLAVSSQSAQDIRELEQIIETAVENLFITHESPFLLTKRQGSLILALEKKLEGILGLFPNPAYELLSYHLKDVLELLTELTGKTISEQGMDAVFREFCVGK